jgi:putative membrane protein
MLWWCAAQTAAWDWSWRAYPGVWLFLLACIGAYALIGRGRARRTGQRVRVGYAIVAFLLMWSALDWPLGTLGGGYLASLHAVQFLFLAMIAPPLLLLALPRVPESGSPPAIARLLLFGAVVFATHLPAISDALMRSQPGAFLVDILWIGGGLLYWAPVVQPEGQGSMSPILRMGYLFALMVLMTGPGALITFADVPLFAVYELAPRVNGFPALSDQRLAGVLMKVGGAVIIWTAISILFYRWHREENRLLQAEIRDMAARSVSTADHL